MSSDRCRQCGYQIPIDATTCPGCARAHRRSAPRAEREAVRRSPLLRMARWARRLLVLTAWVAAAAGLAALARFVAGREAVVDELDPADLERLGEIAHGLAVASVAAAVLAAAALWTWAARARRSLRRLELERRWGSPWSLSGWLTPGRRARLGRLGVDDLWRDTSPAVAALPGAGWSRRPISLVVLHWWTPWTGLPAAALLLAVVVGGPDDLGGRLGLVAVAGAALAAASVRALYDVVGVVTFAQAHRAERLQRSRDLPSWLDEGADDAAAVPDRDLQPLGG